MALLIVGLILFLGVHSFRMASPGTRDALIARWGEGPYKGLYSLVALVGFALIIWGFSRTMSAPEFLYFPAFNLRYLVAGMMLVALILAVASGTPGSYIARTVRNPLLIATILWAAAHLIVNGETATTVLFGAFLVWALADLIAQHWRPAAERPPADWRYDAVAVVAGVVLYVVLVVWAHQWLFGVGAMV
ncbi:NnrU family protein [Bauldia sp.]|uniref:NnrU family protein n=1 Tax=Bauldia sp. TaxID=2575872 RepID=UPI003BAA95BF